MRRFNLPDLNRVPRLKVQTMGESKYPILILTDHLLDIEFEGDVSLFLCMKVLQVLQVLEVLV
jgi:hypothetical protein